MSESKNYQDDSRPKQPDTGIKLVIPFFVTLGILSIVSFIIPLRPTISQMEKRPLAQFPEFSWSALAEGSYFDDITTWFSDTFPGREKWLALSSEIGSLHGYSEIAISGDLPILETIPVAVQTTEPSVPAQSQEVPKEEATLPTEATEEAVPAEPAWGGVDAGDDVEIDLSGEAVIQIGDSAFNIVGFSKAYSDDYARYVNSFAKRMKERGIRVISAPAPTAVGVLIEPEYQAKLNCVDQSATIAYMHGMMTDDIIKLDLCAALVPHNSEYIYFRTDHHWTALGAYYAYAAICDALGREAMPLSEFREWNQGEFQGSLYWKAPKRKKLRLDELYVYVPPAEVRMEIYSSTGGFSREDVMLRDVTQWPIDAKYSTFIASDNPMTILTNDSLPDGPSCILLKDSFGNCLAPYLTQTYHKVYVLDYRKYKTTLEWFLTQYEVDDIIMMPYVIATQGKDGNKLFSFLLQ